MSSLTSAGTLFVWCSAYMQVTPPYTIKFFFFKKKILQRPLSSRLKTKEAHRENDSGTQRSDIWIPTANVVKTLVSETKEKSPGGWKAREKAHRATRLEVSLKEVIVERRVCPCGCVSIQMDSQEWRGELKAGEQGIRTTTGKLPGLQQLLSWDSAEEMK